ncbi:SRPBCC family protein [Aegicerativicinus sediminis]|uniref:SRPBCC family protein n=1 Tax=Aegicerativicinus sediminis TaxID=2893202 RepID=UPI001E5745FD|nr:SRPBCC family protein [Aegicerativicinus sediminis]
MSLDFHVHPNINLAETLPTEFYRSETVFEALKEKVFLKTWQYVGHENLVPFAGFVHPFMYLENYVNEPLLLSKDHLNRINCISNVCTHRGNLVVHDSGQLSDLRCMYHGRRFSIDGTFKSMPEFEDAENFPRPCDNLKQFLVGTMEPFIFVGLKPSFDFDEIVKIMAKKIGFLPLLSFYEYKSRNKDYEVNCHWALYCDNYLEGFHIPFVHEDLNSVLDYGNYTTELHNYASLQIGYADEDEEVFNLPENHEDYGKHVAAYYFWVFPNMMFNFYPWGLSINIVSPISINKTKVSFITYVNDESKLDKGAGALLDKVEKEDEFVVEQVQKGVQSRFYSTGRFSPKREQGVHHFHRLLARFISSS